MVGFHCFQFSQNCGTGTHVVHVSEKEVTVASSSLDSSQYVVLCCAVLSQSSTIITFWFHDPQRIKIINPGDLYARTTI